MPIRIFTFLIALAPAFLLGQPNLNTVTVTASQSVSSQPDQAVFNVTVGSGTDQSLDDIVKLVSSVGISATNLREIAFPPAQTAPPQMRWLFQLSRALSALKQTTASLAALENTIAQSGGSLSFSLAGTQGSGSQAQSCDVAGLIANAQAQAQPSAVAAGSAVGRIAGISGSTSQGSGNCSATVTFGLGYEGNPGPHTISVTAMRSASPVPDEVLILIYVQSPMGAGLDDVTGALTQAGIPGVSLSGVYTETYASNGNVQSLLQWSFTLTTPLANLKSAIAQLIAAQTSIAKQNSGLTLSISSATPQISPQAQPVCSEATLIADAATQAQTLAGAAGVSVGPITAISSIPAISAPVLGAVLSLSGTFSAATGAIGVPAFPSLIAPVPAAAISCSTLVQFQLY